MNCPNCGQPMRRKAETKEVFVFVHYVCPMDGTVRGQYEKKELPKIEIDKK